jgi:hypothetical protein
MAEGVNYGAIADDVFPMYGGIFEKAFGVFAPDSQTSAFVEYTKDAVGTLPQTTDQLKQSMGNLSNTVSNLPSDLAEALPTPTAQFAPNLGTTPLIEQGALSAQLDILPEFGKQPLVSSGAVDVDFTMFKDPQSAGAFTAGLAGPVFAAGTFGIGTVALLLGGLYLLSKKR